MHICRSALDRLPHPLHLVAALLPRQHYHFGWFRSPSSSLEEAQETLAEEVESRLPRGASVLDVGCCLGGTSRLLAERGHATLGVEPCAEAVEFSRASHVGETRLRFVHASLQSLNGAAPRDGFDSIVMIEVLQYFAVLDEVLHRAFELVKPGGSVVVADATKVPDLPWDRAPFHRAGTIATAARAAGFDVTEHRSLTDSVAPTPERMLRRLELERPALHDRFAATRPRLDDEIDELARQCALLRRALHDGDLHYELVALRRPERA